MEIQTFFLAHKIVGHGDKRNHHARFVAIHTINSKDDSSPIPFSPHYLLLLRRQSVDSEETAIVRFRLTDADGHEIQRLKPETFERRFPKGNKFATTTGHFEFVLPGEGDYFLEISLDNSPVAAPHTYYFQVLRKTRTKGFQSKQLTGLS